MRVRAQAFVDVCPVVPGRDDNREPFAQAPQFQRERIAAAVRQTNVNHREGKWRSSGDDLQRSLRGGRLDGLVAEFLQGIDRQRGDQYLVLDQQDFTVRVQLRPPAGRDRLLQQLDFYLR